jgi:hypothetical protein
MAVTRKEMVLCLYHVDYKEICKEGERNESGSAAVDKKRVRTPNRLPSTDSPVAFSII